MIDYLVFFILTRIAEIMGTIGGFGKTLFFLPAKVSLFALPNIKKYVFVGNSAAIGFGVDLSRTVNYQVANRAGLTFLMGISMIINEWKNLF